MAGSAPSARFVIGFDADTSGIDQSKSKLDSLKASIESDTKALKALAQEMANLKGTAEVARWEALPKDIAKADNEVKKLADKMAKLKSDFEKAPADKKEGIFGEGLKTQGALDSAAKRLAALKAEQEKLGKTKPVQLFEDMKAASDKLKSTLGKSQTEFSRLGGTLQETKGRLDHLGDAAKATGSPLGGMIDSFKALKNLGPAAKYAAIAIVLVALATGFALVLYKATAFTIAMSDAARSARLLREANASALVTAQDLKNVTNGVLAKTNAQEEAVSGLAAEYSRLNLSMRTVEKATSAITVANSVLGAQVGSTIKGLIDRGTLMKRFWLNALDLRGTGLALRDVSTQLAKQMKIGIGAAEAALRDGRVKLEDGAAALDAAMEAKFGKIARAQMLALPVQLERVKKNLANLFSGANVEKFLEKMDSALGMFKETEVVGKALKQVFSVIFQPLVDGAGDAFPLLEGFIYGVTIALQKMTITGLRVAIMLKKMIGGSSLFKDLDLMQAGIYAGIGAVVIFTGVMMALGATLATVAISLAIISIPLLAIVAIVVGIGIAIWAAIDTVTSTLDEFAEYLADTGTTFEEAAADIIEGLTNGIADGVADVGKAFAKLGEAGVKAFKDAFGIASPAKKIYAEAKWIAPGITKATREDEPKVASALGRLANPDDVNIEGVRDRFAGQSESSGEDGLSLVLNYYGAGSRSDATQFGQWLLDELRFAKLARAR
jgi:hypothetical protein